MKTTERKINGIRYDLSTWTDGGDVSYEYKRFKSKERAMKEAEKLAKNLSTRVFTEPYILERAKRNGEELNEVILMEMEYRHGEEWDQQVVASYVHGKGWTKY